MTHALEYFQVVLKLPSMSETFSRSCPSEANDLFESRIRLAQREKGAVYLTFIDGDAERTIISAYEHGEAEALLKRQRNRL